MFEYYVSFIVTDFSVQMLMVCILHEIYLNFFPASTYSEQDDR